VRAQFHQLLGFFHALGSGLNAEGVRKFGDRPDDCARPLAGKQVANEAPVDLQLVEGKL
jgi:hypothetical protein